MCVKGVRYVCVFICVHVCVHFTLSFKLVLVYLLYLHFAQN